MPFGDPKPQLCGNDLVPGIMLDWRTGLRNDRICTHVFKTNWRDLTTHLSLPFHPYRRQGLPFGFPIPLFYYSSLLVYERNTSHPGD